MIAEEYRKKINQFGEELEAYRVKLGLSQLELAKKAKLSLRTVINIESKKIDFKPRPKSIIQLLSAVDQSPLEWLGLLGYKDITEEKVTEILKSVGILMPGAIESDEYFEDLSVRITKQKKALLCITFLSRVGLSQSRHIQSILSELVNEKDVFIAMIIPHPQDADIKKTLKTGIVSYYKAIYYDVIEFTKNILLNVRPDRLNRIRIFYPNPLATEFFIPPHVSHSYVRSTLLRLCDIDKKDAYGDFELGAWGTTRHDNRDNWLRMAPNPDGISSGNTEDLLRYWTSYLQEIIEKWYPDTSKNDDTYGFWRQESVLL